MTLDTQISMGNLLTMVIIVGGMLTGYVKFSDRLTKVETTLEIILKHYIILNGHREDKE